LNGKLRAGSRRRSRNPYSASRRNPPPSGGGGANLHSDGTLHVFAIAASGGLAHLPQLVSNGTWGSW
ncbi:hypothetical protein, partial [Streptomyces bobili]